MKFVCIGVFPHHQRESRTQVTHLNHMIERNHESFQADLLESRNKSVSAILVVDQCCCEPADVIIPILQTDLRNQLHQSSGHLEKLFTAVQKLESEKELVIC